MKRVTFYRRPIVHGAFAATLLAGAGGAGAAPVDDLMAAACAAGPAGALATRCADDGANTGQTSGDSDASLLPGQALATGDLSIGRIKGALKDTQEKLEEARKKQAGQTLGLNAGNSADYGNFSLFINAVNEQFDRTRTLDVDQEKGFDGWKSGLQVGGDWRIGDRLIVGGLIGVDHSEATLDPDLPGTNFTPHTDEGGNRSDTVFVNLFTSYGVTENLYVEGTVGVGYTDHTFDRNAVFQETNRATPQTNVFTSGQANGYDLSASVGAGYDFYHKALSFGPYVRVNYAYTVVDAYTEEDRNNSGMNLHVQEDKTTSMTTVLGIQASYAISTDWGVLLPQARFEYEHEFRKDPRTVVTSLAQSNSGALLTVTSDDPDRNYYNIGFGLLAILPNGWMPFVDAEFLASYKDLDRQRYTAGLRVEF